MRRGTDRVFLEGMGFYGRCGVKGKERRKSRRILVDLEVAASFAKAGKSDELQDTVNYRELYNLTKKIVQGKAVCLLERWAEMIAEEVLNGFKVSGVRVRIRKPGALAKGAVPGVEIVRTKA